MLGFMLPSQSNIRDPVLAKGHDVNDPGNLTAGGSMTEKRPGTSYRIFLGNNRYATKAEFLPCRT